MRDDKYKYLYFAISNCFNKNNEGLLEQFINRHRDYLISEQFNDELPYKVKLLKCVEIDRGNGLYIHNIYRLSDNNDPYLVDAIYLTKIEPKEYIYFSGDYIRGNKIEIVKAIAENSMVCLVLMEDDRGEDEIEVILYKRELAETSKLPKLKEMFAMEEKKEFELATLRREIDTFLNS